MPTYSAEAWQRLGERLLARRVELAPRYSNRRTFTEETGLDYRVVGDIEGGRRVNFGRATLAKIEHGYQWAPGSIQEVLEGREPVPAPRAEVPASEEDYPPDVRGVPFLEYIWSADAPESWRRGAVVGARTIMDAETSRPVRGARNRFEDRRA